MITLTVRYGLQNATRNYSTAPAVLDIKRDASLRMELGYGDNTRVLVNGVEQPDHAMLTGSSPTVTVETAANQKAF